MREWIKRGERGRPEGEDEDEDEDEAEGFVAVAPGMWLVLMYEGCTCGLCLSSSQSEMYTAKKLRNCACDEGMP